MILKGSVDTTVLKKPWRETGAPVDGVNGTLAGIADPGDLLIRTDSPSLYQNTNTKASPTWTQLATAAAATNLDGAYDYGGAGAGRAITVDSGAVALTNNAANNNGVLTIEKSPVGAQAGTVVTITAGANCTGVALAIANTGTGNDITATNWSVTQAGQASFVNVVLAEGTAPAAGNAYVARDNDGDLYLNAINGKSVVARVNGTAVLTVAGAAVTVAQALTVSAGGASITGNSSITGDLSVSGSLTFGGAWTVAATLTVDELILDTDGVAPAGTNCYAVRDNAGDLTVNAVTGKQFIVAINNTDEYTFSATIADFLDNAIDNAGFVILNAATAPAGTEVYLVHDNTGDLTLNALTGKDILFAINGTDEVKFDDAAYVFNEASADRDFRVETNGMQYAIYSDGLKDSLVLGSNTDTSSVDHLIRVSRAARANTAATNYFDLCIESAGAITTTGVTAIVATVYINEPNITIGGDSVTTAASLYIAGAPTEGGANYGIVSLGAVGILTDAVDLAIGASADVLMRWSTADADNHAFAVGLGASLAMHVCQAADIATDWNVAANVNPTLYIHGATTPATEYVALSTDETDAHLNAVGANWSVEIGGTAELTISATAVNLAGNTLQGSTADNGELTLAATSSVTVATAYIVANQMLDATVNSLAIRVKAGAIGDGETAQTDLNGELGIDSTNGRIYFRYGAAWHYCAQAAGIQIPADETKGLKIGDRLVLVVDKKLEDGALHGLWVKE